MNEEKVVLTEEILEKNPQLAEQGFEVGQEVDASLLVSENEDAADEGANEGGADEGAAE